MRALRGVIFDFDGTLADSLGLFYDLACEVLERAGAPPVPRAAVYALMGAADPDLVRKLFPPDFPDLDAVLGRVWAECGPAWTRRYQEETQPLPGALPLLHALRARGLALGIATSSGRELRSLDRWGVRGLFGSIVGRESVRRRKPHPEPVLRCAEELALPPAELAYVGDSPVDVRAGRAAGTYTVGVLGGTSPRELLHAEGPDAILESIAELERLL
jgi:HAD superfamily hydrolase (TIGR01509 family)